jgi:hypothetical protein
MLIIVSLMLGLRFDHLNYDIIACSAPIPFDSTTSSCPGNNKKPVKVYANADTQKLNILRGNQNESGIYC